MKGMWDKLRRISCYIALLCTVSFRAKYSTEMLIWKDVLILCRCFLAATFADPGSACPTQLQAASLSQLLTLPPHQSP